LSSASPVKQTGLTHCSLSPARSHGNGLPVRARQHPCRRPWRHGGAPATQLRLSASSPAARRPPAYSTHTRERAKRARASNVRDRARGGSAKQSTLAWRHSGHYGPVVVKRTTALARGAHRDFGTAANRTRKAMELTRRRWGRRRRREPVARAVFPWV
jgi:hypothetical protein